MKKALVLGSAGFLGRNFVRKLVEDGWDVTGIDPAGVTSHNGSLTTVCMNAHRVFDDLSSPRFDLVIHVAAATPHRRAIDTSRVMPLLNAELDSAFFRWAIQTMQHRLLYVSSSAVYSDTLAQTPNGSKVTPFKERHGFAYTPFDTYGQTKRHGEEMAHMASASGVNTVIIRPFSGYGPDQSRDFPFGAFLARTMQNDNPFMIWGNADQQRDFVHVTDIVNGALALVEAEVYHDPVNICTGTGTTMRQLAQHFIGAYRSVVEPMAARPTIKVDEMAPMGVVYRVGDPSTFHKYYTPKIDILEGVVDAVRKAANK